MSLKDSELVLGLYSAMTASVFSTEMKHVLFDVIVGYVYVVENNLFMKEYRTILGKMLLRQQR